MDEYLLGEIHLEKEIEVPEDEVIEVDFTLPFEIEKSEMDEIESKNVIMRRLVRTAKWLSRVKSEYRIEAEAKVKGVALHPFDKKKIVIK